MLAMEVFAHFSGSNAGFFWAGTWQDPAMSTQDFSDAQFSPAKTPRRKENAGKRHGALPLWAFWREPNSSVRDLGEAVAESVDDQLEPVRDVEFVKH